MSHWNLIYICKNLKFWPKYDQIAILSGTGAKLWYSLTMHNLNASSHNSNQEFYSEFFIQLMQCMPQMMEQFLVSFKPSNVVETLEIHDYADWQ